MAAKFREKVKDFRRSLMRFFCLCSAAAPMEHGEAEGRLRFAARSDIDVPAQSEMSNGKMPGLTRDFSHAFQRRVPRQQQQDARSMSEFIEQRLNIKRSDIPVFQPSAATSAHSISLPRQHVTSVPRQQSVPSGSVPRQLAPASVSMPRQNGDRKSEIASILEEMTGPAPSGSIQEVREMYEFIERALTFRRRDLPVFQPSQNPTVPPPLFTHFTPGAVFEPNRAVFTHLGFPAGRAVA